MLAPRLICFQKAGLGPPADLLSLLRQRKQAKKGDPGACVPCASLRGNLRHPSHAAGRPNSLRATCCTCSSTFKQMGASQMTQASVSFGTDARSLTWVSQAQAQGGMRGQGAGAVRVLRSIRRLY